MFFHWKDQSLIFFKSPLSRPADTVISWVTEKKDVLSANSLTLDDKLSDKSLVYIRNNNEPNIEP